MPRPSPRSSQSTAAAGSGDDGAGWTWSSGVGARAHNAPITLRDPTAHAEVLALRAAARETGNYRLERASVYTTVEPCLMCCGALVHARVARLVYGAADPKAGAAASLYRILDDGRLNHRVEVTAGVRAEECAALLTEFFRARRG